MSKIFLDTETIPTQRQRILEAFTRKAQEEMNTALELVRAPANYKDAEKIAAYINERRAELQAKAVADLDAAHRATSLDGAFGQVAVCSMAVDDAEPLAVYEQDWQDPKSESRVLERVNDELATICGNHRGQMLIGHNITFDRRMLRQRGLVHGMRMHHLLTMEVKPWELGQTIVDTMFAWTGDIRGTISMDKLCLALGIEGKGDGLDGSKVWDYVKAGRIAEVAEYCNSDVRRTRRMYRRLMLLDLPQQQPEFDDVPV